MCRKITRQSRWNLRRASDRAIPNQALGMVREGVETGWRASLGDEGTVRLSSKGESDRITQRSAVQIRPPQPRTPLLKKQWRSPVYRNVDSQSVATSPFLDSFRLADYSTGIRKTSPIRSWKLASVCCRQVTIGLQLMAGRNARVSMPLNYYRIPMRRPTLIPMDCWWPLAKL
jgi:hypothetical protein